MLNWIRNPKAPSSLWDGLVFDGAYAGLHPGTNRFVDGSGLGNHGTLTNMDASTDWVWMSELGRWGTYHDGTADRIAVLNSPVLQFRADFTISLHVRLELLSRLHGFFGKTANIWQDVSVSVRQLQANPLINVVLSHNGAARTELTATDGITSTASWNHICVRFRRPTLNAYLNSATILSANWDYDVHQNEQPLFFGQYALGAGDAYGLQGWLCDPLIFTRDISPVENSWLADRANRLYVPDTRRHFWFPSSTIKPWLYSATANHHVGMGLGV